MSKEYGYAGTILKVDLTTKEIEYIPSSRYLPEYFGGRGLLAKLYWDFIPADIDGFDSRNCLIFTTGPLTGTGANQTATGICGSKAPMFRRASYYVSTCGGAWPFEMKYAGFDAFIITGESETPVYLWINDGKCEIRDAAFLKGKTTRHTAEDLRKIHGRKAQIACIGPAGENKVIMASIATDSNTGFSQAGHGAVMGGKNLKAICVRGTGSIKVAEPMKVIEINEKARKVVSGKHGEVRVINGKEQVTVRKPGSSYYMDLCCPTVTDTEAKRDLKMGTIRQRQTGCPGCNIGCKTKRKYVDGSLPVGIVDCAGAIDWADAGTAYYHNKIDNKLTWEFNMVNDDLGLDIFATGTQHFKRPYGKIPVCPSYATSLDMWYQAYCEGILTEENTGLAWGDFGSREFMLDWVYSIAYRKNFGDIIANGMLYAIDYVASHEEFGPNRARIIEMGQRQFPKPGPFGGMNRHQIHGYGPAFFGMAEIPFTMPMPITSLYCATNVKRGKEPNVYMQPNPEVHKKLYGTEKTVDRSYWGPEVGAAVAVQDRYAMKMDSVARCDFNYWNNTPTDEYFELSILATKEYMSAVFGREFTDEEIDAKMEMLVDLERAIWLKEGYLDGPVDTFYDCVFEEENELGQVLIPKESFEQAREYYYQVKDWVGGVPKRSKLETDGLADVADILEKEYDIVLP